LVLRYVLSRRNVDIQLSLGDLWWWSRQRFVASQMTCRLGGFPSCIPMARDAPNNPITRWKSCLLPTVRSRRWCALGPLQYGSVRLRRGWLLRGNLHPFPHVYLRCWILIPLSGPNIQARFLARWRVRRWQGTHSSSCV